MVGLAVVTGLRRGELFALRWKDLDESRQTLTVREAVYDGTFSTPKTAAGVRRVPLSALALDLIGQWKRHALSTDSDALVFATRAGTSISPNNGVTSFDLPSVQDTWVAEGDVAHFSADLLVVVT